jgi:hypothetical protein
MERGEDFGKMVHGKYAARYAKAPPSFARRKPPANGLPENLR